MASFRQQMQELADKIALSRHERQQAVAQFPKMREQLRRTVSRLRDDTRRDLERQADSQTRQLTSFNTQNKKAVSRLLRETRSMRLNRAQAMRAQLQREVAKNRTDIARSLQQHNTQRKRMQRSQTRQSLQAIRGIQSRVESLRSGTRRMTRNLANDRLEARKIWASLKNHSRSPLAAVRLPITYAVASSMGELTGLALPPTV